MGIERKRFGIGSVKTQLELPVLIDFEMVLRPFEQFSDGGGRPEGMLGLLVDVDKPDPDLAAPVGVMPLAMLELMMTRKLFLGVLLEDEDFLNLGITELAGGDE